MLAFFGRKLNGCALSFDCDLATNCASLGRLPVSERTSERASAHQLNQRAFAFAPSLL
jgi:hypothetical protein